MVLIQVAGAVVDKRPHNERISRPVQQVYKGEILATFPSISAAERETGIRHISECVNGIRKSAGGYEWKPIIGEDIWKTN